MIDAAEGVGALRNAVEIRELIEVGMDPAGRRAPYRDVGHTAHRHRDIVEARVRATPTTAPS